jgi:Fe-S-cluster containining protein
MAAGRHHYLWRYAAYRGRIMANNDACREAIASGICHADCCGLIPFGDRFYAQHHELVSEDRLERLLRLSNTNFVLPITDDFRCCFLDRQELKCLIYDERPEICRLFGNVDKLRCPYYDTAGNKRTRAERRRIKKAAEAGIDDQIRKIKLSIRRGSI